MTNHKIRTTLISLLGVAALAACSSSANDTSTSPQDDAVVASADSTGTDPTSTADDVVTEAAAATTATGLDAAEELLAVAATAAEWSESDEIAITLANGASVADGDGVSVDDDVVTITAAGTYRITGTLDDGQIVVDTEDEGVVRLVLDGADVTSSTASALVVTNAEAVVVWLADGSANHLADTASASNTASSEDSTDDSSDDDSTDDDSTDDVPNATLHSADDLVIAGSGALTVVGNSNDAITSKDGLVIVDGTISVIAADDGIRGKDFLVVQGGSITTDVDGDGLTSDDTTTDDAGATVGVGSIWITGGELDIAAATDGMDAEADITINGGDIEIAAGDDAVHAESALTINGGTITVTESYEGLEGASITITAGDIAIVSSDDGINVADGTGATGGGRPGAGGAAAGGQTAGGSGLSAAISGGTIVVNAGGDGIDVNGSLSITGGTIVVNGPTENMNGALDVDGSFVVSDATLVAAGSAGMAMAPSGDGQGVVSVQFQSTLPSGSVIVITDADGSLVAAFQTSKATQSLVVTSPNLESGATYTVSTGGTVDGTTLGGYVLDGTVDGGSSTGTVTAA